MEAEPWLIFNSIAVDSNETVASRSWQSACLAQLGHSRSLLLITIVSRWGLSTSTEARGHGQIPCSSPDLGQGLSLLRLRYLSVRWRSPIGLFWGCVHGGGGALRGFVNRAQGNPPCVLALSPRYLPPVLITSGQISSITSSP